MFHSLCLSICQVPKIHCTASWREKVLVQTQLAFALSFLTFSITVPHVLQYVLLLPHFLLPLFAVSTQLTQNTHQLN